MSIVPRFLKPVRWLKYTSTSADEYNPEFTVGETRSLRWQLWWMDHMPHRTYPHIPFRKVVFWHWRGKTLTLPRPWAKDLMKHD